MVHFKMNAVLCHVVSLVICMRCTDGEIHIADDIQLSERLVGVEKALLTQRERTEELSLQLERLVNSILSQTIDMQNLEKMILTQNVDSLKIRNQVLEIYNKIFEGTVNQMAAGPKCNGSIRNEIESRGHLNKKYEILAEKMKKIEMYQQTCALKNETDGIRGEIRFHFSNLTSEVDYIKSQKDIMQFRLRNVTNELVKMKDDNAGVRERLDVCIEKQNLLDSELQTTANLTAVLWKQMNKTQSDVQDLENEIKVLPDRATDCQDIEKGSSSGVYTIRLPDQSSVQVYCDMKTDGGGWTVFQRRFNGSENFYRTWNAYKEGFGRKGGEHWLGDSLTYHNGMMFSTKDADNDASDGNSCAVVWKGGWWYKSCYFCNLNGLYRPSKTIGDRYNNWTMWPGGKLNMKTTTMMIRKM